MKSQQIKLLVLLFLFCFIRTQNETEMAETEEENEPEPEPESEPEPEKEEIVYETTFKMTYNTTFNFFTIPITIGTPKEGEKDQQFIVQVDTTTSETWVPYKSTGIPESYDETKSTTAVPTEKEIRIEDEDGVVNGTSFIDSITLLPKSFTVENYGFVAVETFEEGFHDYKYGKLGLGYNLNYGDNYGFVKMMKKQGIIKEEKFYIDWSKKKITFGDIPDEMENEVFSYCNLTKTDDLLNIYRSGWVCDMSHIYLYNNNEQIASKGYDIDLGLDIKSRVVFDTAYEFISIPKKGFYEMFRKNHFDPIFGDHCEEKKVDPEGKEIYLECDYDSHNYFSSNITFVIGGYGFIIKGEDVFRRNSEGRLEGMIHFIDNKDVNLWALGAPFMKVHTFIFDYDSKSVGIWEQKRINLFDQWDAWMHGKSPAQRKEMMRKLLIGAGIVGGVLLLIIILIVIIKSCRKRNSTDIEHGPLIKEEQNPY